MKKIVQIELTNICNRKCSYCGIPVMTRPKGFMSFSTVERCVEVLKEIGQTDTVGLAHYGESLLHPDLLRIIEYLNCNNLTPFLNTNGDFLTDELIDKLSNYNLYHLLISGHIEIEKRQELYQKCVDKGITAYWQQTLADNPNITTVGGQIPIDWEIVTGRTPLQNPMERCGFLRNEQAIVMWNGDLVPCCFDYDGVGIFGNIHDENASSLIPVPFRVCDTCPGHPANL